MTCLCLIEAGTYAGAVNLQLAWRRNTMKGLVMTAGDLPMLHGIPHVDGGVIEGNVNASGGKLVVLGLNDTRNVVLK